MSMANILGAGGRGLAERRNQHNVIFEEIVPSSGWTEDSDCCCLIIDLPGFKKDEVKLQVDNYGHILVSGERQVNEVKHIRFQQSYRVPDNSNIEETTARFEDDILYIIIPKTAAERNENNGVIDAAQADHIQEENQQCDIAKDHEVLDDNQDKIENQQTKKGLNKEEKRGEEEDRGEERAEEFHDARKENAWNEYESSILETITVQLKKNKGIVVTAILAFTLGILVSQKFQTNYEN